MCTQFSIPFNYKALANRVVKYTLWKNEERLFEGESNLR